MLIFVYGDDGFRVAQKVRVMKAAFVKKFDPTSLNTQEFPGERKKLEPGEVLGAVRALPFLGKRRMVIIRDLIDSTKKADMKIWVDGLTDAPETSIVIFWETSSPKAIERKALYKALKGVSEVHHYAFPKLEGIGLSRWVASRVKEREGTIGSVALRDLLTRVGGDLWQMDHEIHKLVAFADGAEITCEMIINLVEASFEGKIFDLIDAISQRRSADAIRLLQEERWSGTNDHYLLTMLGRQVRVLLGVRAMLDENVQVSKQKIANTLDIHPFVAQKAMRQVQGLSVENLKHAHGQLFDFDQKMKTGQLQADMAVDLITVALAQ